MAQLSAAPDWCSQVVNLQLVVACAAQPCDPGHYFSVCSCFFAPHMSWSVWVSMGKEPSPTSQPWTSASGAPAGGLFHSSQAAPWDARLRWTPPSSGEPPAESHSTAHRQPLVLSGCTMRSARHAPHARPRPLSLRGLQSTGPCTNGLGLGLSTTDGMAAGPRPPCRLWGSAQHLSRTTRPSRPRAPETAGHPGLVAGWRGLRAVPPLLTSRWTCSSAKRSSALSAHPAGLASVQFPSAGLICVAGGDCLSELQCLVAMLVAGMPLPHSRVIYMCNYP
ncbi:hypothetical protein NDU88_006339 [Pleurodeles waltl]|uniref:Uncharacterized protein n=1 Tax=Pleurodeles waltl TaxID=8319 RepID=A0AAV7WXC0_PLEWA|nr:hypothetical protein NDU88_006339 [Pleurodeles waltl]